MPQTERAAERATQIAIPNVLADAESLAPSLVHLQACRLTRRCAISLAMAAVVAPFVFGEGPNA
jgi:hypothetical protein